MECHIEYAITYMDLKVKLPTKKLYKEEKREKSISMCELLWVQLITGDRQPAIIHMLKLFFLHKFLNFNFPCIFRYALVHLPILLHGMVILIDIVSDRNLQNN